jgi:AmiR/NasT family two-component response regulator
MAVVQRTKPDVAIFAVGLPDGDGVAVATEVITKAACPVVLFTSHTDENLTERAREAGVMAYLLKPLRPAELAPALDLAVARFREARELRQSLEDRKVIERAKGRLMERHALTEEQAFQRLRRAAMDSRRPMVEIARAVLVSDTVTSGTTNSR